MCDACEADIFGYNIAGILVSDFVTPAWFRRAGKAPFDFLRHMTKPFQIISGGYIGVWNNGTWTQKYELGHVHSYLDRPRVGSRRERRRIGKENWIVSTVR